MGYGVSKNGKQCINETIISDITQCSDDTLNRLINADYVSDTTETETETKYDAFSVISCEEPTITDTQIKSLKMFDKILLCSCEKEMLKTINSSSHNPILKPSIWQIKDIGLFINYKLPDYINIYESIDIKYTDELKDAITTRHNLKYDKLIFLNNLTSPVVVSVVTMNSKVFEITLVPMKKVCIECNIFSICLISYQLAEFFNVEPFWLLYEKNSMLNVKNSRQMNTTFSMTTEINQSFDSYKTTTQRHKNFRIIRKSYRSYIKVQCFEFTKIGEIVNLFTKVKDILKVMKQNVDMFNMDTLSDNIQIYDELTEHMNYIYTSASSPNLIY